jgi:hypothetical protein
MKDDATITRIRETRHGISERCEHDPRKVIEYYLELQKKYQGRLLIEEPEPARLRVPTETIPLQLGAINSAA